MYNLGEMNKEILLSNGINPDNAIARLGGDDKFYSSLLEMFLDDGSMPKIEKALAAKDQKEVFDNVHCLKGVAANLSFDALYFVASQMTELFRKGIPDYDRAEALYGNLKKEYDKTKAAIKAAL